MKRTLKRSISLLLTVCMVLGILAVPGIIPVRAESTEATPETTPEVILTEKNLIANGTFGEVREVSYYTSEHDAELGWSYTNMSLMQIEATNAYAFDGAYSLHVTHANNAAAASVWQAIQLPEYTAGVTKGKLTLQALGEVDAKGTYISVQFRSGDNGGGTSLKNYTTYLTSTDNWQEYVAEGVIPEGAKSARVYIAYCGTDKATDIYVDNISLTIGDTEIPLTNASCDNLPDGATPSVKEVFVKNAEGWVAESGIASKIQKDATGENALLYLDGTKANAAAYSHYYPIQVEGGATYKAVFNYKSTGEYVHLYANEFDAEGERIKQQFPKFEAKETLDGATEYKFKATQAGTVEVQLRPYFHKDYDGEAWFDNIAFYKVCTHDFSGEPVVTPAT
ncbi:MAG: hypothetical protein IKV47_08060, partial [Oscillospiraceae bacterium]|nr:hypothetical protein [Oscillospiraceae bacterium]